MKTHYKFDGDGIIIDGELEDKTLVFFNAGFAGRIACYSFFNSKNFYPIAGFKLKSWKK